MDQRNGVNSVARIIYVQIAEKDRFPYVVSSSPIADQRLGSFIYHAPARRGVLQNEDYHAKDRVAANLEPSAPHENLDILRALMWSRGTSRTSAILIRFGLTNDGWDDHIENLPATRLAGFGDAHLFVRLKQCRA